MQPVEEAIRERVLVCDGAMGTLLYTSGAFVNRPFDELNVTTPGLVLDAHRAYVAAGANVIETNTFGANRARLDGFGIGGRVEELNAAGVSLARQAAGGSAYVAGAIGPPGVALGSDAGASETVADCIAEQAAALAEAHVDLFVLETFRSLAVAASAVAAVRSVSHLPIVAQVATRETGETEDGASPEDVARTLAGMGATVVGVNCAGAPAILEALDRMHRVTDRPLSAQPNAGHPRQVEGRTMYLSSPDYLASYARRFVRSGARLVGGCCGTTPDHIRQIAASVLVPV